MDRVLTVCPFCSCGCGLFLRSDDGVVTGVAPSAGHPMSQGRLCARGWGAHEATSWGERLGRPLLRRDGALREVTWELALAEAERGLRDLQAAARPLGVLSSARASNEESYLAVRLARGALGTGNIDLPLRAGYAAQRAVLPPCGGIADIAASDLVIVVEGDVAASHPQVASAVLRAVAAGGRLVTFGTARTQLARLASLHVRTLPGEERREIAAAWSAEPLAEWLIRTQRLAIVVGPAGRADEGMAGVAGELARLLESLPAEGRAVVTLPLPARFNGRGAHDVGVAPDVLPGRRRLDDAGAVRRLTAAWGQVPAGESGLESCELLHGVDGLVVFGEEVPASWRDERAARGRLEAMPFLVVIDSFVTETSRSADVVLPIASQAETEGTATSLEGVRQRLRPAAPLPGQARQGWRVLADLTAALGLGNGFLSVGDVEAELQSILRADDDFAVPAVPSQSSGVPGRAGDGLIAALDNVYDWGSDPLVRMSPTLSRDHAAFRKAYPRGAVRMARKDADDIGIRPGWLVKLTSATGEGTAALVVDAELDPGLVLVPFALRARLAGVFAGGWCSAVQVSRA